MSSPGSVKITYDITDLDEKLAARRQTGIPLGSRENLPTIRLIPHRAPTPEDVRLYAKWDAEIEALLAGD